MREPVQPDGTPTESRDDSDTVHRAHPQRVALFAALVVGGLLFGYLAEVWIGATLQPLSDAAEVDPEAALRELGVIFQRIATVMAVCSVAAGAAIARYARRVSAESRFPTRSTVMLRDTPVLSGPAAQRRARALSGIAVVVAISGLVLAWFVSRMMSVFG